MKRVSSYRIYGVNSAKRGSARLFVVVPPQGITGNVTLLTSVFSFARRDSVVMDTEAGSGHNLKRFLKIIINQLINKYKDKRQMIENPICNLYNAINKINTEV